MKTIHFYHKHTTQYVVCALQYCELWKITAKFSRVELVGSLSLCWWPNKTQQITRFLSFCSSAMSDQLRIYQTGYLANIANCFCAIIAVCVVTTITHAQVISTLCLHKPLKSCMWESYPFLIVGQAWEQGNVLTYNCQYVHNKCPTTTAGDNMAS